MKTVLVDVNVVLDVLLERQPHVAASSAVWAAAESGEVKGLLAAHAITTIHYLIRKETGSAAKAKRIVTALLTVFSIATVDQSVIGRALDLDFADFEDAVTAAAARKANCDLIITRDPRGFRRSPVPAVTPEAAAHIMRAG